MPDEGQMMQRENRTRLRWLDAARGLAMLLVMIGHTVPGNETVIGALYTFHLPLFFVISGYASRPVHDWRSFVRRHVRSFFRLIVPCVVLQMGLMVYLCLLEGNLSAGRLIGLEKRAILQLFWASAQSVSGRPALGIPWFMFALFWGRMLFDLLRMVFRWHAVLACVLVSAAGLAIGTAAYLPQSMDLAMVSVLFLCAGEQLRWLDTLGSRVRRSVLLTAALVWALGLRQGVRIDMAVHQYGPYGLGVPVSLCASAVVCALMQRLDGCAPLSVPLAFVGRISLPVFLVHHVDDYIMGWWYRESWWLCCVNRIVVVVGIAALVHAAAWGVRRICSGLRCSRRSR